MEAVVDRREDALLIPARDNKISEEMVLLVRK